MEWREKYGTIYTYYFVKFFTDMLYIILLFSSRLPEFYLTLKTISGFQYVVAVNDYKTAVEMFVKDGDTYADRGATEALDYATRGGLFGIIESSGGLWKEQRRFALRVLRDFGLGKNVMQDRVRLCKGVFRDL